MQQLLNALKRRHIVVNLDPMNDLLPYECAIDVMKLTDGAQVMRDHNLGPNGGGTLRNVSHYRSQRCLQR